MATYPLITTNLPYKHTYDTSVLRENDFPSVIRDNNGRIILFYQKRLKSGRLSESTVTFVSPSLSCTVEAGNGEVNSNPVSWASVVLALPMNSYVLVYVDDLGNVGYTDDFPISFTKNVITLAFVSVGETTIVRVLPVEKDGFYIFHRRQVLSGSEYVWDDYEYRLNVGEKPEVSYDSINDKMYMTFQKDGSSFSRVFNVSDPLTWQDLDNVLEVAPTLYFIPQPAVELPLDVGYGDVFNQVVQASLFLLARELAVGLHAESNEPYVHLPYVAGTFVAYMIPPGILEVFTKSGSVYTLEAQFEIGAVEYYRGLDTLWTYSRGVKYLGLRINHNLYVGDFVTDPSDYVQIVIPDFKDETELQDIYNIRSEIFPEVWDMSPGYGKGDWLKVSELDQVFSFSDESAPSVEVGYGVGDWIKGEESEQNFAFSDESTIVVGVGYSGVENTITNV